MLEWNVGKGSLLVGVQIDTATIEIIKGIIKGAKNLWLDKVLR